MPDTGDLLPQNTTNFRRWYVHVVNENQDFSLFRWIFQFRGYNLTRLSYGMTTNDLWRLELWKGEAKALTLPIFCVFQAFYLDIVIDIFENWKFFPFLCMQRWPSPTKVTFCCSDDGVNVLNRQTWFSLFCRRQDSFDFVFLTFATFFLESRFKLLLIFPNQSTRKIREHKTMRVILFYLHFYSKFTTILLQSEKIVFHFNQTKAKVWTESHLSYQTKTSEFLRLARKPNGTHVEKISFRDNLSWKSRFCCFFFPNLMFVQMHSTLN